jgi:tRNA(fMet)-specific endonuclease VapC
MILDTNAVSALLAGEEKVNDLLSAIERPHLPVVVIGEYLYGLKSSTHHKRLRALLEMLIRESIVLLVDEPTAEHYAEVRNELRDKGRPIPENDVWIAALARQHGLPVISRDQHFDEVDGVIRHSWQA